MVEIEVIVEPAIGNDIGRLRGREGWRLADTEYQLITEMQVPLELSQDPISEYPRGTAIQFELQTDQLSATGVATELSTETISSLLSSGAISTTVDSLTRSVITQQVSKDILLDSLESCPAVTEQELKTVRDGLLLSINRYTEQETQGSIEDHLERLVQRHELQHVADLIDPETALLKEIELFWQLQLVSASPDMLRDPTVVRRLGTLYVIPKRYTVELSAMLAERPDNSFVPEAVVKAIEDRRGAEQLLLDFFSEQGLDHEDIHDILNREIAQQYCDIWLYHVIDQLDRGSTVRDIDEELFLERLGIEKPEDPPATEQQFRSSIADFGPDFREFVQAHLYGPAVETISVAEVNNQFVLQRLWYNTNPTVSGEEHRLAVRRALFLRTFLDAFRGHSSLPANRRRVEQAIESRLRGNKVEPLISLFDIDVSRLQHEIEWSLTEAASDLTEDLDTLGRWLNEPDYELSQS